MKTEKYFLNQNRIVAENSFTLLMLNEHSLKDKHFSLNKYIFSFFYQKCVRDENIILKE